MLRAHVAQHHSNWDMMEKVEQVQFKDQPLLTHDGKNYSAPDIGPTTEILRGLRAHGV